MSESTVTLRYRDQDFAKQAAAFVAELVRQGVLFDASEDYASSPARLSSEPVLVVKFTGGF